MNLRVDIAVELENSKMQLTNEQSEKLQELKDMIGLKLDPFWKFMEEEESMNTCYVMLHLLPDPIEFNLPIEERKNDLHLTFHGYSPELTKAISQTLADGLWAIHIEEMESKNVKSKFSDN